MTRSQIAATVITFLCFAAAAAAQVRVDHRDPSYPAGFFDTLAPGTPVAGRPGLVWMHDGTGWIQVSATPVPPPTVATPTQFDPDCADVNPYANPEKAAECAKRPLPGASTPQFLVGHIYSYGYDQQRAVVLGLSTDRDGVQVATFSWLPESGNEGVTAMRTPPQPGGRSPWNYVGKQ